MELAGGHCLLTRTQEMSSVFCEKSFEGRVKLGLFVANANGTAENGVSLANKK